MNYLLQAIKSQRVRKSLTVINVLGLSVCVAAALLILLYVRYELSYDSFHDGKRVYRIESRLYEGEHLTDNWATTTFGHAPAIEKEIPGVEKYVRVTAQDRERVVSYEDRLFPENLYCYTESSFFEIFNFPIIAGEKTGQLTRPNTLVLTQTAAHRYFGKTDPLGKVLTFRTASAEENFEVTGVIADMPGNSHLKYDFLLSYSTIPKVRQDIWYIHGVYTYVRLKPGINASDVESGFRRISGKYKTDALRHKIWAVELIPLKDIHLTPQKGYEKEAKGNRIAIYILASMAAALLLIGWVNALNLAVARFLERGKEFGVRKAFGASCRQIITQGLTEAGLIHVLAVLIALGWLEILLPLVSSRTGSYFGTNILLQPDFWAIVCIVLAIGTLFIGLYPSYLQFRIRPTDIMRGQLLHSKKGNAIRKTLIMLQFIASFILITGTFVVIRQVCYMQNESNSSQTKQVVVVKYPSFTDNMSARMESFKKQLKQFSHINDVTISGAIPGVEVANYFGNRRYGSPITEAKLIQMFAVDYDYLNTYNPEVVCGRGFSEEFGEDRNKLVLNEEAVRQLGFHSNTDAIGQQLKMEVVNGPLEIVGVVKDYHQQSLTVPYRPIIFFISELVPFIATPYISIRVEGAIDNKRITEIEKLYKEFFPTSLFSYFPLDKFNDNLYKEDKSFGWVFACSALLAVFVACLGLWTMTLFSIFSRLKEIGVRKILGAGKASLLMTLTREILRLILLSSVIGIPTSMYLMNRWLENYAFHASIPWYSYALAFILLAIIAFVTIFRQVWRTIHLKPMRILKSE